MYKGLHRVKHYMTHHVHKGKLNLAVYIKSKSRHNILLDPVHSGDLSCFTISSVKTHISGVMICARLECGRSWVLCKPKTIKLVCVASLLSMQYNGIISINVVSQPVT
jgi:hypothetical protein